MASRSGSKSRKKGPSGPGPSHAKEYDPLNDQHLEHFFSRRQKHLVEAGLVDQGGRVLNSTEGKDTARHVKEQQIKATEEALMREEAEIRARVQKQKLMQLEEERKAKVASLMKEQSRIREEIVHLAKSLAAITTGDEAAGGGGMSSRSVSPVRPSTSAAPPPPLTDFAASLGEVSMTIMSSVLSLNNGSPPSSSSRPKTSAGFGSASSSKHSSVSPTKLKGAATGAGLAAQSVVGGEAMGSLYLSEEETFKGGGQGKAASASSASSKPTATAAAAVLGSRPKTGAGGASNSSATTSPRASTSANAARVATAGAGGRSSHHHGAAQQQLQPAPGAAPGAVAVAAAATAPAQLSSTVPAGSLGAAPATPAPPSSAHHPHRSAAALSAAAAEAILGANPRPASMMRHGRPGAASAAHDGATAATAAAAGGAGGEAAATPGTPRRKGAQQQKPGTAGGALRRTPLRGPRTPGGAASQRALSQSQQLEEHERQQQQQQQQQQAEQGPPQEGTSQTFQNYFPGGGPTSPPSSPSAHLLPMSQPLSPQALEQLRHQQAQASQVVGALLPPQPYQPGSFLTTSANMHLARPFYVPASSSLSTTGAGGFAGATMPGGQYSGTSGFALPVNPSIAPNLALPRGYLPSGPVLNLPTNMSQLPEFKDTPLPSAGADTPASALLSSMKTPSSSLMDEAFVTSIIDRALASHGLSRVLHLSAGNKAFSTGDNGALTPAALPTPALGSPSGAGNGSTSSAAANAFLMSGRQLASISEGGALESPALPSPAALPPTPAAAYGSASAAAGIHFSSVSSLTAGLMPRLTMPEMPTGAAGSALLQYTQQQQGNGGLTGTIGNAMRQAATSVKQI